MFDTEKFIKLVKTRPVLWDTSHPDYPNRIVKMLHWEDVGREMHADWDNVGRGEIILRAKVLEKKWKNIKDCFARELKLQKASESGFKRKYLYFEQLLFLMPVYMSRREKKELLELRWEPVEEYQHPDSNHVTSNDCSDKTLDPGLISPIQSFHETEDILVKFEPQSPNSVASDDTTTKFLRESRESDEADDPLKKDKIDERGNDELVGRSIAAELALFKESKEKRVLKAKMFQLIAEYDGPVK